jgi:hypothetical protein
MYSWIRSRKISMVWWLECNRLAIPMISGPVHFCKGQILFSCIPVLANWSSSKPFSNNCAGTSRHGNTVGYLTAVHPRGNEQDILMASLSSPRGNLCASSELAGRRENCLAPSISVLLWSAFRDWLNTRYDKNTLEQCFTCRMRPAWRHGHPHLRALRRGQCREIM